MKETRVFAFELSSHYPSIYIYIYILMCFVLVATYPLRYQLVAHTQCGFDGITVDLYCLEVVMRPPWRVLMIKSQVLEVYKHDPIKHGKVERTMTPCLVVGGWMNRDK